MIFPKRKNKWTLLFCLMSCAGIRNFGLLGYRAVRYDNISDGWNKKSYRFILCSIVYFEVSQNTLFTVIPFHHLGDCDLYTPPRGVKGRQNQVENNQPGQDEELVLKWGTTFVAWTRVFKHCSFKTTDFKSLKLEVNRYGFFSCRYLEIRATGYMMPNFFFWADMFGRFSFFLFFLHLIKSKSSNKK